MEEKPKRRKKSDLPNMLNQVYTSADVAKLANHRGTLGNDFGSYVDKPKRQPGGGRKPKPESEKTVVKQVYLYPHEWDQLLQPGEGPTDAVRRLLSTQK